ncbi:hypothetical protein RB195_022478 [Necator americanus]|uniref:Uncharacterized protein n=1 Tax=Necator americanus TaxID=51031 RepID=A0ABR1EFH0_NECAM
MSRVIGRFPCPPTMIFLHEKRVTVKEASGGQQPGETIAIPFSFRSPSPNLHLSYVVPSALGLLQSNHVKFDTLCTFEKGTYVNDSRNEDVLSDLRFDRLSPVATQIFLHEKALAVGANQLSLQKLLTLLKRE